MFGADWVAYFDNIFLCVPISLIYVVIFWVIFRKIYIYFHNIFPKPNQLLRRLFFLLGSMLMLYFVLKKVIKEALVYIIPASANLQERHNESAEIGTIMVIFLVTSIYELLFFYHRLKQTEIEKTNLEKANIFTQLQGLRNHVNPHFLFNSLNSLAQLIPEDQERAERFVLQMSKVYRYILEMREKKLIPVREELDFLKSYIFLLNERFADKLVVEIKIPPPLKDRQIVPLALQILIENAIKHNIVSKEKPLVIEIFNSGENKLIIKNNLQKKNTVPSSTGFGLQNIKTRYNFYTDQDVDIIVTNDYFIVSLPLLIVKEPRPQLV